MGEPGALDSAVPAGRNAGPVELGLHLGPADTYGQAVAVGGSVADLSAINRVGQLDLPVEFDGAADGALAKESVTEQPAPPDQVPCGLPVGTGPLYKCAICQELVYESQLDYHVQVCPDPNVQDCVVHNNGVATFGPDVSDSMKAATGPSTEITTNCGTLDCSVSSYSSTVPCAAPADKAAGAATVSPMSTSQAVGGFGSVSEAPGSARSSNPRRSKAEEEARIKDVAECTFQPKINPRSAHRISTPLENHQYVRNLKLHQVEAQAYVEVTHHPQISQFAQNWSQKQQDALTGAGVESLSVFERLYSVAQDRAVRRQSMSSEMEEVDHFTPSFAVALGSVKRGPPRTVPTSELLYSDALDRRERLKDMAAQMKLKDDELAREKTQVLSRSRRYYWQMLERQIKVAFDMATGSEGGEGAVLLKSQLEDFLIHFGCAPPKRNSNRCDTSAGEVVAIGPESEVSQICPKLWQYLDPQEQGHVGLFTLTVFFHVLMGAVDGFGPNIGAEARDVASPGADVQDNVPALAAIAEEEEAAKTKQGAGDASGGFAQADGPSESDKYIIELLHRLDPQRLRSEFHHLYSQRMYYQRLSQEKPAPEPPDQQVVAPEICPQSRKLAAKVFERQKGESDKPIQSHADLMMWRYNKTEAKKAERRVQASNSDLHGCTFRPKTSPKPWDMTAEIATPRGATRGQVLYARAVAERERQQLRVQEKNRERFQAEVNSCTFQPNTARSERSYNRLSRLEGRGVGGGSAAPVPRGFHETRHRLRNAGESHRQIWQAREDRLGRLTSRDDRPEADLQQRRSSSYGPASKVVSTSAGGNAGFEPPRRSQSRGSTGQETPVSAKGLRHSLSSTGNTGIGSRHARANVSPSRQQPARGQRSSVGGQRPNQQVSARGRRSTPNATSQLQPVQDVPPFNMQRSLSADVAGRFTGAAGEGAGAGPPTLPTGPSQYLAENHREPIAQQPMPPQPQPILYVDVNIAPGQPMQRLVMCEGQSVSSVAFEFAARHALAPGMAQRLHKMLEELLQRHGT